MRKVVVSIMEIWGAVTGAGVGVVMRSNPSSLRLSSQPHCLPPIHSVHRLRSTSSPAPTTSLDDFSVPWRRTTWHRIQLCTSPHFTPDPNSWSKDFSSAQLHLWGAGLSYFFLWSQRPQLLSLVWSHKRANHLIPCCEILHLRYLTKLEHLEVHGMNLIHMECVSQHRQTMWWMQ